MPTRCKTVAPPAVVVVPGTVPYPAEGRVYPGMLDVHVSYRYRALIPLDTVMIDKSGTASYPVGHGVVAAVPSVTHTARPTVKATATAAPRPPTAPAHRDRSPTRDREARGTRAGEAAVRGAAPRIPATDGAAETHASANP